MLIIKKMDHYTGLASHYDEYYRYSDAYVNYFTEKIVEDLAIRRRETVVEVGSDRPFGACAAASARYSWG